VSYYTNKSTPVFSAFLDASEAFYRTNHNLLSTKLIKRNIPMCIVRLLRSWYTHHTMQMKWNTDFSSPFHIYSLFALMNCQTSWVLPEWDALWAT